MPSSGFRSGAYPGSILAVGAVAVVAILFWPSNGTNGAEALAYPTYSEDLVAQGETYFQANCATCHGVDGSGNAAAGIPALNGSMHTWHHPDSQLAQIIRQGGARMPPVGAGWSDEEVEAVLAYIKEWWAPELRAVQARTSDANP